MPSINLDIELKDRKTIRTLLEELQVTGKDILLLAKSIQVKYHKTEKRAFSLALLEHYLLLKQKTEPQKFPDFKALLAYKIRNALLDSANQRATSVIINQHISELIHIKGWLSHRLFTVLEIIELEESLTVSSDNGKSPANVDSSQFECLVLENDQTFFNIAANNQLVSGADAYEYGGLQQLTPDNQTALETSLGKNKVELLTALLAYIQERLAQHKSRQFTFFSHVYGTELNREGRASIYYACDLISRLLLQPDLSPAQVAAPVIDRDNKILELQGIGHSHALTRIVANMRLDNEVKASIQAKPLEIPKDQDGYYNLLKKLMSTLPKNQALIAFVQSKTPSVINETTAGIVSQQIPAISSNSLPGLFQ